MSLLWKYENKVKVDYKARLEYKLYLARENPEPVFDVSDCGLKSVPSGIYSLCKVFRKEALYMQCNRLNSLSGGGALSNLSLITILDLHSNELHSLPAEIGHLVSLKELYLQENNIKKLPNEISNLTRLTHLDVSRNHLKCLPEPVGYLRNLVSLNVGDNKFLQQLPKTLGHAQKLQHLGLDNLNLSYPPVDVLDGGAVVIVAFLAAECGIEYSTRLEDSEKNQNDDASQREIHNKENEIQAVLAKLERMKACGQIETYLTCSRFVFTKDHLIGHVQEQRQHALLKVESDMKEQKDVELQLQNKLKIHKQKLLEDLAEQQLQLEQEIEKVQQERDFNRERLLSFIYNAEKDADSVIKEFLRSSEEERQSQAMLVELETREELEMLSRSQSEQFTLRKRDTILAMEQLLEEELKEKKFAEYTKFRDYTAQSLLSLEVRNNEHLTQVMQDQEKNRQGLVSRIGQDEALQKAALAALLERSDTRSWSIVQQVNLIQSQLAALTNIELERRKLEINQHLNDIADRRVTLSVILMNLLDQQEKRRKQLLETIQNIEEQNNTRKNSSFWLMQYQSLMEARPQGMLETLEPNLVRHIAIAGALHCLPFLSSLPSMITNFNIDDLRRLGIHNENDQESIKMAVENYLAEKKLISNEPVALPTAPVDEASSSYGEPTAPSEQIVAHNTAECVVCMDAQCEIIFLSCGHLCCCANCADAITTECPMCRSPIERKIKCIIP